MRLAFAGLMALGCLVGCGEDEGGGGAGGAGGSGGSGGASGSGAGVAEVALGATHTCAVSTVGEVKCWGANDQGQLGQGNTEPIGDDELPSSAPVVDVGGKVAEVACGFSHTCVLLEDKSVKCWGANSFGQLGYGNTNTIGDDEVPSGIGAVSLGEGALQVVAGRDFSCALLESGAVRCWGARTAALGLGMLVVVGDDETPTAVDPLDVGGNVTALAAGFFHVCAVLESGGVNCWGDAGPAGRQMQVIGDDESPAAAGTLDVGASVSFVAGGPQHTCAVTAEGTVRCWGANDRRQLGYDSPDSIGDDEAPSAAGDVPLAASTVALGVGRSHSCAQTSSGDVECWGQGAALGTGNSNPVNSAASAVAVQLGGPVDAIASGLAHVCSLSGGALRCWGVGSSGELGLGNTESIGDDEVPTEVGPLLVF